MVRRESAGWERTVSVLRTNLRKGSSNSPPAVPSSYRLPVTTSQLAFLACYSVQSPKHVL